ncbi:PAS domain-containing protein [Marivibrio halodurans]|uniref:PAS domain-containing protein n=1 Tax=Marivibrio halodurans TaxID=2039722 RepID=A0A8J7SQ65_9PROT|nr:PAS domain-containing protein [Marivibrio halodurans]MBP5858846.1 PAS domain-containing protein [Marivibrio halodurans]
MTDVNAIAKASVEVRDMIAAWAMARADGAPVPFKRDFDPIAIPRLLPHIWIYRFDPELDDFVCRLAGERINLAWGAVSLRGQRFRDIVGVKNHASALRRWLDVIQTPLVQYGMQEDPLGGTNHAERLVLPMASEGGTVDYTIGLSLYERRQTDHKLTPPVWDNVHRIACAELDADFLARLKR